MSEIFSRQFWWARRLAEEPIAHDDTCGNPACTSAGKLPFDIYCRAETGVSHLLPLRGSRAEQSVVAAFACLGVAGLVLLGASLPSRAPLFAVAASAGLATVGLPLRRFRRARAVAIGGWATIFALAAAWRENCFSAGAEAYMVIGLFALLLAGLVAAVAFENEVSGRVELFSHRVHATLWTGAAALCVMRVVIAAEADPSISKAGDDLALAAITCLVVGVVTAAVVALLRATHVRPLVKFVRPDRYVPKSFRRPQNPLPPSGADESFVVRVSYAVTLVLVRAASLSVEIADRLHVAFLWLLDVVRVAAALIVYAVRLVAVWVWAVVREAAKATVREIEGALRLIGSAAWHWLSSSVLTALVVVAAATLAVVACDWFQAYLVGGPLWQGPLALCAAGCAAAALVILWWTLTKSDPNHVWDAAQHNISGAGPAVLLGLLAIAWLDGIAGLAGYAPIRPGLMTIGGTTVMCIVVFATLRRAPKRVAPASN